MKRIYDSIGKLELIITKASLGALTLLVFASAIARTIKHPIAWAVDAATFLFAWCVFLSGDIALRNDKLVSIDLFTKKLPKKAKFCLKIFNDLLIIVFLIMLIGYGFKLSYTTRLRTFQGIPGFSYTWVTLSVPAGSMLMLMTTIKKIISNIKYGPEGLKSTSGSTEVM